MKPWCKTYTIKNKITVLVWVSITVVNTITKKHHGEERVYVAYTCISQSITEESQFMVESRKPEANQKPWGNTAHRCALYGLVSFLSWPSRTTCSAVDPATVNMQVNFRKAFNSILSSSSKIRLGLCQVGKKKKTKQTQNSTCEKEKVMITFKKWGSYITHSKAQRTLMAEITEEAEDVGEPQ